MELVRTLLTISASAFKGGRFILITLFLLRTVEGAIIAPETKPVAPATSKSAGGAKFLFIVDTSSTMERFEHNGRQAIFDLVYSGISNQMQAGDSFGIWTFNEQVSAGVFPMQVWEPAHRLEMASAAGLFLRQQRYHGKPRPDLAMAKAIGLLKSVKDFSVVMLTSGDGPLGTSELEVKLQGFYQSKAEKGRGSNLPVLMAFSAIDGQIAVAEVTLDGEPVRLPPNLLAQMRKPPVPVKKPVLGVEEPPHVRASPIIMIGKAKPEPSVKSIEPRNFSLDWDEGVPVGRAGSTKTDLAMNDEDVAKHDVNNQPPSELATAAELSSATSDASEAGRLPDVGLNTLKVSAREPSTTGISKESPPIAASVGLTGTSGEGADGRVVVIVGAAAFAAALLGMVWVFLRIRTGKQASIISQSMSRR